ncbi:hypothetical protein [Rhodococcus jostii]|uniref:hypothetical protein n=1 Tax=Rhodococcus jostii TaxID=132919 RepID=UPI00363152D7
MKIHLTQAVVAVGLVAIAWAISAYYVAETEPLKHALVIGGAFLAVGWGLAAVIAWSQRRNKPKD